MSKTYDVAEKIKVFLESVSGLETVPFVVNRQRDIAKAPKIAIGKQVGCIAIIDWVESNNQDLTADGPRFVSRYSITLFSKPVIKTGFYADDIIEAIETALHDHRIDVNDHFRDRVVVLGTTTIDHPELLVNQTNITTTTQL